MAYKRTVLNSPTVNQPSYIAGAKKHVGYRNCHMYMSQDSGYNDSLKAFSPDSGESSSESLESGTPSQDYENSENLDPSLECSPIREIFPEHGTQSKIRHAPEIYETPRVAKKDFSLRRRLLLSKATSGGNLDFDASDSVAETLGRRKTVQRIPSFETGLSTNFVDSPRDAAYKPIATSTLKTESDSSISCKNWRLSFAQQRSSTLDESKGDAVPFPEVENLSPVQHSTESSDDSILSVIEENITELHATPARVISDNKEAFQTPISNLAASFRFNLCTPTGTPATDLENSVNEDSAFHSLSFDKSQDSLTDHEGSFQELIQKQKETPKSTQNKSRLRKLDRCRRLSTLRERGSQSEVEEESKETHILSSSYKSKVTRNSVTEESEFSFEDCTNHSLLRVEDLTGTPALRVVREMVVRSTRKRSQRATIQELLGSLDCSDGPDDDLTRLIGRKMGLEQLDILSELKYRNLKHVISFIFKVLNVETICSIWKVSKEWREMVSQDKDANQRRKLFMKKLRVETEQSWIFSSEDAATRFSLLNRSALKSVQAQSKSVFHTPTTSSGFLTPKDNGFVPQSASKRQEYVKIAKTLFTDEALKPCPQCQYPAKVQPLKKRGKCSRKDCGFDFCVLCLCAFHGSKECSGGSGKRVHKKDVLPGSAQSKRNLKRL